MNKLKKNNNAICEICKNPIKLGVENFGYDSRTKLNPHHSSCLKKLLSENEEHFYCIDCVCCTNNKNPFHKESHKTKPCVQGSLK